MLGKDKVHILVQLIQALDEAVDKMDGARRSKNSDDFEKFKKLAEDFQSKIGETLV